MCWHLVVVVFLQLAPLPTGAKNGEIRTLVLNAANQQPLPTAHVTLSRVKQKGTSSGSTEIQTKAVDDKGMATFKDLSPGEYMVLAVTESDGNNHRHLGTAAFTRVSSDSVSSVVISVDPKKAVPFPSDGSMPEYRMQYVVPDTSREERMPIYNPEKKVSGSKKKHTQNNVPNE